MRQPDQWRQGGSNPTATATSFCCLDQRLPRSATILSIKYQDRFLRLPLICPHLLPRLRDPGRSQWPPSPHRLPASGRCPQVRVDIQRHGRADLCPSIRWTALTLAPADTDSDAAVCRSRAGSASAVRRACGRSRTSHPSRAAGACAPLPGRGSAKSKSSGSLPRHLRTPTALTEAHFQASRRHDGRLSGQYGMRPSWMTNANKRAAVGPRWRHESRAFTSRSPLVVGAWRCPVAGFDPTASSSRTIMERFCDLPRWSRTGCDLVLCVIPQHMGGAVLERLWARCGRGRRPRPVQTGVAVRRPMAGGPAGRGGLAMAGACDGPGALRGRRGDLTAANAAPLDC